MTDPTELLRIASTGWGFVERHRVDGWELRASGGFTGRANSAWPLAPAETERPLEETVAEIEAWYAARDLPTRLNAIAGTDLDDALEALGYQVKYTPALRQTAPLAPAYEILKTTARADQHIEITTDIPQQYVDLYQRGAGQEHAATVLTSGGADLRFAVIRDEEGDLLACGRLGIMQSAKYANLAALRTAEKARRQGLCRAILRDLVEIAADHGAENLYLEVEPANAEARPLYTALGFTTNHEYHYRIRP